MNKKVAGFVSVIVLSAGVMMVSGSPPSGVTPTLLARGTYDAFHVMTHRDNDPSTQDVDAEVKSKQPVDIVVRQHDYAVNSTTGWHKHPGPVLITVKTGTVTFYEADDPTCTPHNVSAGQGYVDAGAGHIGRNESGAAATDVTVIFAPVATGGALNNFREELPLNANPNCPFVQ